MTNPAAGTRASIESRSTRLERMMARHEVVVGGEKEPADAGPADDGESKVGRSASMHNLPTYDDAPRLSRPQMIAEALSGLAQGRRSSLGLSEARDRYTSFAFDYPSAQIGRGGALHLSARGRPGSIRQRTHSLDSIQESVQGTLPQLVPRGPSPSTRPAAKTAGLL